MAAMLVPALLLAEFWQSSSSHSPVGGYHRLCGTDFQARPRNRRSPKPSARLHAELVLLRAELAHVGVPRVGPQRRGIASEEGPSPCPEGISPSALRNPNVLRGDVRPRSHKSKNPPVSVRRGAAAGSPTGTPPGGRSSGPTTSTTPKPLGKGRMAALRGEAGGCGRGGCSTQSGQTRRGRRTPQGRGEGCVIQSALKGVAININLMFEIWLLLPYLYCFLFTTNIAAKFVCCAAGRNLICSPALAYND